MYTHMNEDVARLRLHELERELEASGQVDASGLMAESGRSLVDWAGRLVAYTWRLARPAARRPEPSSGLEAADCEDQAATAPDAA